MPLGDPLKEQWTAQMVRRMGGRATPEPAQVLPPAWVKARKDLEAGLARAHLQLTALRAGLIASGDGDLAGIANRLGEVLGVHPSRLKATLIAAEKAKGNARRGALTSLVAAVDELLAELASSPTVAACDGNPVAVPVSLRTTLETPLGALRAQTNKALAGE